MEIFLNKVKMCIDKYGMIVSDDIVIVGVSGGPDSLALLYSLYYLREELDIGIIVAHLNHLIRGEEADMEAVFVEYHAKRLGLPCTVKKVDVPGYMKEKGLSSQVAAREVRYRFFESELKRRSANKIALGHTANDQAETVLMRMMRGSGMKGLAGIPPVRDGMIIRPMIEITRREIEEFLSVKGIEYVKDPSNLDFHYLRNRIRGELIPILERDYNPRIIEILRNSAEILKDDEDYLSGYCKDIFCNLLIEEKEGTVILDASGLRDLHVALQRRVLRKGLKVLKEDLRRISGRHISDILRLVKTGASNRYLDLPGDITVRYTYNRLYFSFCGKMRFTGQPSAGHGESIRVSEKALMIPGSTSIPDLNLKLDTEIRDIDDVDPDFNNNLKALLDYEKTGSSLWIRTRRAGDRFHPFGMSGSKKLKDFFIDERVPGEERDRILLLVSDNKILWVVGMRVSEDVRLTDETKKVLIIDVERP